jgi:hypothetical protein
MYDILFNWKSGTVRYRLTELVLVPVSVLACAFMAGLVFFLVYKLIGLILSLFLVSPISLAIIIFGGIVWKKTV